MHQKATSNVITVIREPPFTATASRGMPRFATSGRPDLRRQSITNAAKAVNELNCEWSGSENRLEGGFVRQDRPQNAAAFGKTTSPMRRPPVGPLVFEQLR
jgi:hypothetical protein